MSRLVGLVVCLVALATSTCLRQHEAPPAASPQASALPAAPRTTIPPSPERERFLRELERAGVWSGERVLPFSLHPDRERARADSLAGRAERRSFEGAPPAMPHSASFGAGTEDCLDCHTTGVRIGDRTGHPMSHAPLTNCTQCHVESRHPDLAPAPRAANSFAGLRPSRAAQATPPGAPMPIPHGLRLRTRCLSCHGELGYPGLRTSHPERAQCIQCHLPTAESP